MALIRPVIPRLDYNLILYVQDFLQWIGLKQKLHETSKGPKFFKEGKIWWCAVGENIGVEINRKGVTFSRPVFVYRKLSRNGFLGIPLSTKLKDGSWYVRVTFKKEICANLAQVKVFSSSRMYTKMGELDEIDAEKIKAGFLQLYSS